MVRSKWARILIIALASTSLTWGQSAPPATWAPGSPSIITIQEPGKPALKCRLIRTWRDADGTEKEEVQIIGTGETMIMTKTTPSAPAAAAPPPAAAAECIVTITENGKEIKCRPVKAWQLPAGMQAYQVQTLDSGEMLTLVVTDSAPAGSSETAVTTRIYHWGQNNTSPPGARSRRRH